MGIRDYPRSGQSMYDYVSDTTFDLFEQKLDAIIDKSDKPKDRRTNEEKVKDALNDHRSLKMRFKRNKFY